MVKKAQSDDSRRRAELCSCVAFGRARRGVPRGMVVRDRKRPPIVSQHGIENVADGKQRAVDCAVRDHNRPAHAVRAVADEHNYALSAKPR